MPGPVAPEEPTVYRLVLAPAIVLMTSLSVPAAEPARSSGETRVFEMRTYYAHPGKMKALHARFRDHTCNLI